MVAPPSEEGASQVKVALALPGVALKSVGAVDGIGAGGGAVGKARLKIVPVSSERVGLVRFCPVRGSVWSFNVTVKHPFEYVGPGSPITGSQ